MKKFVPFALALAFTTLALGLALFLVRPGIRSLRAPQGGWRHAVEDAIGEAVERTEDRE
jgi:hypothetical protein